MHRQGGKRVKRQKIGKDGDEGIGRRYCYCVVAVLPGTPHHSATNPACSLASPRRRRARERSFADCGAVFCSVARRSRHEH